MPPDQPQPPTAQSPPRRRRRRRAWLVIAPLAALALGAGLLQTPVAAWIVEPVLESQSGMRVQTGSVRISVLGGVTITNARFTEPAIPGPAGEVLRVDRVAARIDWTSTLRGSPGLNRLRLVGPELRLSQDTRTGVLNAASFKLISGGGGGPTPSVAVERGAIELGEHTADRYTALRRWNVSGQVDPAGPGGVSDFAFGAITADPALGPAPAGSLALSGSLGPDGLTARLDGLALEDWPASIVPSRLREVYATMALSGRLLPTHFTIDNDGRVAVRMTLDGVDLTLPFNERYDLAGEGEMLRMRRTRGTIEFGHDGLAADVNGLIDELRYDVDFTYQGLTADAPFDARLTTRFRMDDRFRPRRFLPPRAVEKLDMFESPSADVDAVVRIARPREGAPIRVEGRAEFANGSATYRKFRYPFTGLAGAVSFDSDSLTIERVEGRGPSGAVLTGQGRFDGLGEDARVAIDLDVAGVPIDRHMMDALTTGRRQLVEALFNPARHQDLVDDALIRTPDGRGGPHAPLFEFGGAADVQLQLRRVPERPENDRWTRDTTVRIERAGLVPEHFPLPIVAHGIELRIHGDDISLTGGRYEGLTGGTARVEAAIDQTPPRPGRDTLPVVEITAADIPIDERLLAAIPGYRDEPGPDQPVTLRTILDNLRIAGVVQCHAMIGPRQDGTLGYDVQANFHNAAARPNAAIPGLPAPSPAEPDPLVMSGMSGVIFVNERLIVVDFAGTLLSPARPLAPTPITLLTQLTLPERRGGVGDVRRVGGLLPIQAGPPVPGPALYARARADGLDLAMPLEHAAAVVSPQLAERLAALRDERRPDGVLALRLELDGIVGGHTETALSLERVQSFAFDHAGARHRVGPSRGAMTLHLGVHPGVAFQGFRVPVESGGAPAGELTLNGALPLLPPRPTPGDQARVKSLHASLRDGRVESPATAQIVGAFVGPRVAAWLAERRVAGAYDADLTLTPIPGAPARTIQGAAEFALPALSAVGQLRPRTLALDLPESRLDFDTVEGVVRFEGLGGRVDALAANAPGLSLSVDGPWSFTPGQGVGFDLALDVDGERLNESVRTLLPAGVLAVMDRFEVSVQGPLNTDDLRLTAQGLGAPGSTLTVSGRSEIAAASAVVGVPLTEIEGRVEFAADVTPAGVGYAVQFHADRLRAGSLRVEQARATVLADESRPGVVLIPRITARLHGGRVAGSAQTHAADDATRYWLDLHASGVRAAPVFDDLLLPPDGLVGPPPPGEQTLRSAWTVADDYTRGVLDADLSVSGLAGQPDRTIGRGSVRIAGGSVIALPGLINLIEFSNLRAPVGARLDLAEGDFYLDGTTVAFERLSAASRTVEILGHGTMDWLTRELNLRFRSRSIRPVPIFSKLVEQIRDELITTRVTGRPGSLEYSAESFGDTRRLFRALLGEPESEHERVMAAVEQASRDAKNRAPGRAVAPVQPAENPAAWADPPP